MTLITIGQAVKLTGKSKTTIHKLTKNGTLSVAKKNDRGHNLYDPSELIRVFSERSVNLKGEPKLTQNGTDKELDGAHEKNTDERLVYILEKQVEELKRQNQNLEEKNNKLTDELLSINKRLLEPPKRKKFFGLF